MKPENLIAESKPGDARRAGALVEKWRGLEYSTDGDLQEMIIKAFWEVRAELRAELNA